jgi:hypothetical protein
VILCDLTTCYSIESAWVQRLKLRYDELVSNFAFNFNLRRYSMIGRPSLENAEVHAVIEVERCRVAVSKPVLKAPMASALETVIP